MTDPFPPSLGLKASDLSATAVTISIDDSNYNFLDDIEGTPKIICGPGEYELSGIYITGLMTPDVTTPDGEQKTVDNQQSQPAKRNTAYLIEIEGVRVCHLGNIRAPLSNKQVEQLSPVDILLLPVGAADTVEISQGIEIVRNLEPKIVIPMHYKVPYLKVKLGELSRFLREMGIRGQHPQNRLNVTASNLPHEMRVTILEAQGKRPN